EKVAGERDFPLVDCANRSTHRNWVILARVWTARLTINNSPVPKTISRVVPVQGKSERLGPVAGVGNPV
ncbi:MAG: hypothetical protein ABEK50_09815, partial [bacterium]